MRHLFKTKLWVPGLVPCFALVIACSHAPSPSASSGAAAGNDEVADAGGARESSNFELKDILLNEGHHGKKLILKFEPDVPGYDVRDLPERRMSELRWRASARVSFSKEMVFPEATSGLSKLNLAVDSKSGSGVLEFYHQTMGNYSVTRVGKDLVLSLRAPTAARTPAAEPTPSRSASHRVSISVKDTPLAKLLRSLASESHHSLVLGSPVEGRVSVTLQDLPYEQAVDMILKPTGYRADHQGDVTVVRPEKDDTTFRAFQLKHVDVNVIYNEVKMMASSGAKVTVDGNTNTVFVTDKAEWMAGIERMLNALDRQPRQVEVEAAILELDHSNELQLGTDYPNPAAAATSSVGTTPIVSPLAYAPYTFSQNISPLQEADPNAKGLFVGLSWRNIHAIVSVLATTTKLHYLARPRVLALSDQPASIVLGSQLGYHTLNTAITGVTENVQFLTVGTQLKIQPHVTETNDILMYIKPEVSDGAVDPTTQVPHTNTTTSESRVLAKSGQTIVIAGLFKDRVEKDVQKVPLLGDIPIIGFLFSGTTFIKQKTELVILLSPHVLSDEGDPATAREGSDAIERFYKGEKVGRPAAAWGTYGGE